MLSPPADPARRGFILRAVEIAGTAALTAAVGRSGPVAAKATKSELMYQDHRHEGKHCADCKFFSPDNANPGVGSCSIVEGVISREGWCTAFAPKALA
jgi:hypothetical protein